MRFHSNTVKLRKLRSKKSSPVHLDVQELYRTYLKKPLGDKAHHLLHTDHEAWSATPENT